MKVVIVYGQVHHGNTYKLTQMLIEKLNCKKEDIKEFNVNGMPQCVGCYQCIMKDEQLCPHREKTGPIIEAIEEADVIIFASPNYCFGITGQLKSLCDHMAYRWLSHRPYDMRNKIGIGISTTAGAGAKRVTKMITEQFLWWSVGKTYQLPFIVMSDNIDTITVKRNKELKKKVRRLANKINKSEGKVKPGLKVKLYFKMMQLMHKKMEWNEVESKYWKSKGWV